MPRLMVWPMNTPARLGSMLLLLILTSGCATSGPLTAAYDPIEPVNRGVYAFNDRVDRAILKPVADGYTRVTPGPVRRSVGNFFDNAAYPNVIVNDLLQGKLRQSAADSARFMVNTTVGIGGLFDVARHMGLARHQEDLGQTLARWHVAEGPYLVVPLLGPRATRDLPDLVTGTFTNALFYVAVFAAPAVSVPVAILAATDQRARAENAVRYRNSAATEPYIFTREGWRQHRHFLIYDGHPPLADPFDDPAFLDGLDDPADDRALR